ncbi:GNAT family N-acetyltransferase [Deinococcus multiflagellatus]|uniref:GNAT family N-acetyltransferase n=1 Tax=Deinococcus multiflagellatus TaxID=1656887 RepID=A0ABW1ZLC4_9DEIO|nr:GNAT family N-acetyltransferase [Deinococcus multiflagellatus]MBZ9713932.1 GNAT family N-acetyltransferase [Deinococcus multiflagellatus]
MSPFTLRDLRKPDDFAGVARVLSASDPDWPVTAELLAVWDAARDPELYHTVVVAEQDGQLVGLGQAGHDDFAYEDWRYFGAATVHPDARGQGIGRALYDELMARLRARGAQDIRTMLSDQPRDEAGRAFLTRRGFTRTWDRYESRLHTGELDLGVFDELLAGVAAHGIELRSIADLAGDEHRDRRLYELDWRLFQDVPMGQALTKRPFEAWRKQELDDPTFSHELSFVALRPGLDDPETGPYVGYSTLMKAPGGFYVIGMTGVRREDRGLGVAKALKVAAMRALHAAGGGEIRTFNDPPNKAMLGMNRALGFRPGPTRSRYELHLDPVTGERRPIAAGSGV